MARDILHLESQGNGPAPNPQPTPSVASTRPPLVPAYSAPSRLPVAVEPAQGSAGPEGPGYTSPLASQFPAWDLLPPDPYIRRKRKPQS